MAETVKHKAVKATIWRLLEVGGRQLINLVVTTTLARLIMPEQFGLVAMISIFIAISEVFIDSGFSIALIRDSKRTAADCSTVFFFNIVISIICFGILYFCSPYISAFYKQPELTVVTRVVAITLIISAFGSVQRTILSAELQFRKISVANLISLVISGVIGIILALNDYQVWALVFQTITARVISTIIIWFQSDWRPKWLFSWMSFKRYFKFGSSLLGSALLDTTYNQSFSLIIGKCFNSSNLAFYNRAGNFANLASSLPTSVVESVAFPTLCKLQDDTSKLKDGYRRLLKLTAFIVFPLCLGLGAVAYPFINVLLTDRWIFAATLMQIIVFSRMWFPIHSINLNLLKVIGKSNLFFKLEIYKKIVGICVLCITVPIGLKAMCYGSICSSLIALIINTHYTGKYLNMGIIEQLKDLIPAILLSVVMFVSVFLTATALGNGVISLMASILVGAAIYISGALIFRFPEIQEIKNLRK